MAERQRNGRFPPRPGKDASGIPAKGEGWGGDAKGAGAGPITEAEHARALAALSKDKAHLATKQALAAEMLAVKVRLAREAEHEAVRLAAAEKVNERLLGKPTVGTPDADGRQVEEVRYRWAREDEA